MYIPLEEGEHIVAQVHKHWWFIFLRIVGLACFLVIPLLVWVVARWFNLVVLIHATSAAYVVVGALWALVGWVMFWQFWTLYYMDMWIVTNKRLIDIDYIAFFNRNIAMLRLDKIQDMTIVVGDVFGSVLGYGTIVVQTAASDKEFRVEQISNPEELRDAISRLAGAGTH
jgi:hypothetical protein